MKEAQKQMKLLQELDYTLYIVSLSINLENITEEISASN